MSSKFQESNILLLMESVGLLKNGIDMMSKVCFGRHVWRLSCQAVGFRWSVQQVGDPLPLHSITVWFSDLLEHVWHQTIKLSFYPEITLLTSQYGAQYYKLYPETKHTLVELLSIISFNWRCTQNQYIWQNFSNFFRLTHLVAEKLNSRNFQPNPLARFRCRPRFVIPTPDPLPAVTPFSHTLWVITLPCVSQALPTCVLSHTYRRTLHTVWFLDAPGWTCTCMTCIAWNAVLRVIIDSRLIFQTASHA